MILSDSFFMAFKPDPYSFKGGERLLTTDIIRCCTNFVLNLINMVIAWRDMKSDNKRKKNIIFTWFLEIGLFILFLSQLIFLLERTPEETLFENQFEVINWPSIRRQSNVQEMIDIFVMLFSLIVTTFALKYGWTMFAPELFGLPRATGDNAFGVAVVMLTTKMFFGGVK